MRLLEKFLKEKTPELIEKNVRLQTIGRLTDLPESSQQQRHKTIEQTAGNTGLTLVLALSYGGRLEIIDGIKSLLRAIALGHIEIGRASCRECVWIRTRMAWPLTNRRE